MSRKILSFSAFRTGGAEGNRTPDLCSAIGTLGRVSRDQSITFPILQSGNNAPFRRFVGRFRRTLAGLVPERIRRAPAALRWGMLAAWLGWELFGVLRAYVILWPVLRGMWAPVLS